MLMCDNYIVVQDVVHRRTMQLRVFILFLHHHYHSAPQQQVGFKQHVDILVTNMLLFIATSKPETTTATNKVLTLTLE